MNAPYQNQTIIIPLDQIKIVHIYRYLYQQKSIRIVTDSCQEYIFEFQKTKYCQKAIETLIGSEKEDGAKGLCVNASNKIFTSMIDYY